MSQIHGALVRDGLKYLGKFQGKQSPSLHGWEVYYDCLESLGEECREANSPLASAFLSNLPLVLHEGSASMSSQQFRMPLILVMA